MSDPYKQRIHEALAASRAAKVKEQSDKAAKEEAQKKDYLDFKEIVDNKIAPTFHEFAEMLVHEGCHPEIDFDLREDTGNASINFNTVQITFTAPNSAGKYGGGPFAKVGFQRDPEGNVKLILETHDVSLKDNTGTKKLDRAQISRDMILEVLTSTFEKIVR